MARRSMKSTGGGISLDALVKDIMAGAGGEDGRLKSLWKAFRENVPLPADAFVIGEPLSVVGIDYDGNTRRGLTARCRRGDGSAYVISAADVEFPEKSEGARRVAAYRKWLQLDPRPEGVSSASRRKRQHKAEPDDLDLDGPVELIALSVKDPSVRCRLPGSGRVITLRAGGLLTAVPGEILTVKPRKRWQYSGHPYLSGEIVKTRLDVDALGLVPLRLLKTGMWDPADEYWGEEGEPLEDWAMQIISRGPRPQFEMEQVLPGEDPRKIDSDPINESLDLRNEGDPRGADRMLMEMLESDLRCLDAHAHLGNRAFDHFAEEAIRSYEVGVRIGELSLGENFEGVLPWGHINNRPFLRCMHGYGLCLWRMKRPAEAEKIFKRMLWLNPSDSQGARFSFAAVRAGKSWESCAESDDGI